MKLIQFKAELKLNLNWKKIYFELTFIVYQLLVRVHNGIRHFNWKGLEMFHSVEVSGKWMET